MISKHTPGPWKQSLPDDTAIYGADGWPVCETGIYQGYDEHFERMEADARLIAAAPELLEALKSMLDKAYKQNWNDNYPDQVRKAEEAITKATGGSQ